MTTACLTELSALAMPASETGTIRAIGSLFSSMYAWWHSSASCRAARHTC